MALPESPRNYHEALAWFIAEHKKPIGQAATPSGTWMGYCLIDVRLSYGIPALAGSAWAAWLMADPEDRVITEDFDSAPVGAALITKGTNPAGHIYVAGFDFPSGNSGAWSNDLVRNGGLDKVHRDAPVTVWGHRKVGWLRAVNGYDLQLQSLTKPPKPKQDKQYKGIAKAITNLEHALETAKRQGDKADVKMLSNQIRHLQAKYAKARRS